MPEEELEEATTTTEGAVGGDAAAPSDVPENLSEAADTTLGTVGGIWADFVDHLPLLAAGAIILLLTWLISAVVQRIVLKGLERSRFRNSLQVLITRLISIAVWTVGILITLVVVFPGLTPTKALGGLGLLSVAIGFAFKDIFENFFAGVLLLWKFPFEEGDFIECEDIAGRVVDITVRMTLIRKVSGELVVVPNSFLFTNPVDVLTDRPKRRAILMIGVAYDADLGEAVEVLRKTVLGCETVLKDEPVRILPHAFGESSMDIEVEWWTKPEPVQVRESRAEVVLALKRALDEAEIEIPYPYRTLTFHEPLKTIASRSGRGEKKNEG